MLTYRYWKLIFNCFDNPVVVALVSFFLAAQLLAIQYNRRAWFVVVPIGSADLNESIALDFEKILDNMKTNESTFQNVDPDKTLVMVGVMTAQKLLDTRAVMIHSTWGKRVPGKIHYFSSAGSKTDYDLPLISLPGVDDSYPPQKKSFMMLKFMYDNYADKFEWFMRMDDDVYVKPERLTKFLRSLNSSEKLLIGQPGLGNPKEFGLMGLNHEDNYCMGGPGMIMSRSALKTIADNISFCTNNMMTTHEDVEVGRCFTKLGNITCTWNYEMSRLLRADYSSVDGSGSSFNGDLMVPDVLESITLHPIKKPADFYRADVFLQGRRIAELRQRKLELATENHQLDDKKSAPVGVDYERRQFPKKRTNYYDYEFLGYSEIFSGRFDTPRRGFGGAWKRYINEAKRQLNEQIYDSWVHRNSNRTRMLAFKEHDYAYVKQHPTNGVELVLQMQKPIKRRVILRTRYQGLLFREDSMDTAEFITLPNEFRKDTSSYFRDLVHMFMPMKSNADLAAAPVDIEGISSPTLDDLVKKTQATNELEHNEYQVHKRVGTKVIRFIMPLNRRWNIFKRFMRNFERVLFEDPNENHFSLVVVYFPNNETQLIVDEEVTGNQQGFLQGNLVAQVLEQLKAKYAHKVSEDTIRLIVKEGPFSRSIGLEAGAALYASNELLFMCDVDMFFTSDYLLRMRLNTIEGKQIYYPIMFTEYTPESPFEAIKFFRGQANDSLMLNTHKNLNNHFEMLYEKGYWIYFGYGMVSLYNSDLRRAGGYNLDIVGWGIEDVDLHIKFVNSNLTIVKVADPGLTHVFHNMECDPNLAPKQMIMCIGSKSASIASQRKLARVIFDKKLYVIEPPINGTQPVETK